jgi:hypothetical protein
MKFAPSCIVFLLNVTNASAAFSTVRPIRDPSLPSVCSLYYVAVPLVRWLATAALFSNQVAATPFEPKDSQKPSDQDMKSRTHLRVYSPLPMFPLISQSRRTSTPHNSNLTARFPSPIPHLSLRPTKPHSLTPLTKTCIQATLN